MPSFPIPPGETRRVETPSALVIAPHADDETLGCGGLVAQLAAGGAAVRVLYLTDSAGAPPGEPGLAARRAAEAAAAIAILGVAGHERTELPDGQLARHLDAAAAAIRRALLAQRPRLLLVPSPLEVSADHRAAFAAVHRVLTAIRPGDDLATALDGLEVLLYELNRPLHPDLLVDVSGELPLLERAIAAHSSQLERHPYGRAALGLRHFRTLTLGPNVMAAEAYRRLTLADFVTAGPSALVTRLGGTPAPIWIEDGPLVSVIVRTKDRPALLAQALASLAAGSYRRVEVLLVNDGGAPPEPPPDFPFALRRVDHAASRGRAAAANAGLALASGDYVGFLDDDDLVEPEHLETLVGFARATAAPVVYTDAAVAIYEPDAELGWRCVERSLPYSRDFDPDLLCFDNYIPLHTLLVERALLERAGPLDESFEFFEDWDLLIRLAALTRFLHLARVTCEYRHFRGSAHHALGELPRDRPDFLATKARVLEKHRDAVPAARLAAVVDRLRAEGVLALHEAERRRRELAESTERSAREIHRLHFAAEQQTEHIGRLYAEIERLGAQIRAMESTRAWRAHLRWQRLRGR